jgi:hypothetical protein
MEEGEERVNYALLFKPNDDHKRFRWKERERESDQLECTRKEMKSNEINRGR